MPISLCQLDTEPGSLPGVFHSATWWLCQVSCRDWYRAEGNIMGPSLPSSVEGHLHSSVGLPQPLLRAYCAWDLLVLNLGCLWASLEFYKMPPSRLGTIPVNSEAPRLGAHHSYFLKPWDSKVQPGEPVSWQLPDLWGESTSLAAPVSRTSQLESEM